MFMLFSCANFSSEENCKKSQPNSNLADMIVSVHGFGRNESAMKKLSDHFACEGFVSKVVGYKTFSQELNEIEDEFFSKINKLNLNKYRKVHFVGHSFGGLLIRSYLKEHKLKNLGKVVNIGSPSKGTPVVDHIKDRWWFNCLIPAAVSMSSQGSKFLDKIKNPDYPLGIIAGIKDVGGMLDGKNDGIVPLKSTKVEGMTDFIEIKSGHGMLRYNEDVAKQSVTFIRYGKFQKKDHFISK